MCGNNSILIGYYGDDFTGSTDVMEALTRGGLRTVCFLTPPTPETIRKYEGLRAFGVAGISRSLPSEEMEAELRPVFEAIRDMKAPLIHYKTCSTFDSSPEIGSIGKAIDVGYDVFSPPYVSTMIGAPILGRYCVFGNLFARSGLDTEPFRLDRHPTMSRHPITPMNESDLRIHLSQQTTKKTALFDILEVAKPLEAARKSFETLLEEKPDIVLFDTLYDDHLPTIGNLIGSQADPENPIFLVGSSGVEYALAAYWHSIGISEPRTFPDPGEVDQLLTLSGSCSPVSGRQIQWAVDHGSCEIPLDTEKLLGSEETDKECEQAARNALELLDQGRSVIIHTAKGPSDIRREGTIRRLKEIGMSEMDIKLRSGKFFGEAMGKIFLRIMQQKKLRRTAVIGGDTCGYFAKHVGIEAVEMIGPLAPGGPLCHIHKPDSPLDGLEILFKGGQVGKTDIFRIIKRGVPPTDE